MTAADSKNVTPVITVTGIPQRGKIAEILQFLNKAERPLSPKEISLKTGLKHSTVKVYLRRLLEKGLIAQLFRGYYSNLTIHDVNNGVLVHNVTLSIDAPWLVSKIEDFNEVAEDARIRVVFGVTRKKVTVFISSDNGLTLEALRFAVKYALGIVFRMTGHDVDKVIVKTFEPNRDYRGFRLDGNLGCLTIYEFDGFLNRVYQKDDETVRVESKISEEMPLENVFSLLRGGVCARFESSQILLVMLRKVEELIKAYKGQNRFLLELGKRIDTLERHGE